MADDVINIKDGPELLLTFVIGHDASGKGGRRSVANLLSFGLVGGVPGPVLAQGKIVYGNNEGGQYSPVAYNEEPSAFALVMRDFSGNFTINDPSAAAHPASMQWVQSQVATAVPLTQKAAANGVATLDAAGKVPTAQLNISGLNYLGAWNAATNTPALTNGTGAAGDFYKVSVAGSHDFGAGAIVFAVGDWVIYEGGVWQQFGAHEAVASVNGKTGVVVLTATDVGAVALTGDQTVAGTKTFSASPVVPTPTADEHAATKAYVDNSVSGTGNASSGAFAPTLTAGTSEGFRYIRVGAIVHVFGTISITPTSTGNVPIGVQLPVAAVIPSQFDLSGVATSYDGTTGAPDAYGTVFGDATNNRANVNVEVPNTNQRFVTIAFSYYVQ